MFRVALFVSVAACGPISPPPQPAPAQAAPDPQFAASQDSALSTPTTQVEAAPVATPASSSVAQRFVAAHNAVRAKHCAPPLTWSPKLEQVAQKWADSLREQGCKFGHSGNNSYGENLAAGSTGILDPEATVKMWYDEIAKYKFPDGGFSMETGHFTQVVWKGTSQVGCGKSTCNGMDIWVCNYEMAGNWEGQYRDNVLPLGCK